MKKGFFLICLVSLTATAQSWQWGKRGGSSDVIQSDNFNRKEEVYSIATDSQKNIYVLSKVGKWDLNVDGNVKTNYGDSGTYPDVCLASFTCSGAYRWSKIIGGNSGYDEVASVKVDSQDNVYIAGTFGSSSDQDYYPQRIDNDVVLSQTPNFDGSLSFIAKYSTTGTLLWFVRPQPSFVSQTATANSCGLEIDSQGNLYWLMYLPAGTYANGAFVNTMAGQNFFILKYNTSGSFISATPINLQAQYSFWLNLQFKRNPYNGSFYFTSTKAGTATASVNGQPITHAAFMACYDSTGTFQWVREDTTTAIQGGKLALYNIEFDSDNNIYLGGRIVGGPNGTSFLGFSVPTLTTPGFIMKVNPTATTLLWSSYNNKGALERGALALNNNEIAWAGHCYGEDFTWAGQTLNANVLGTLTEVLLARFDKNTGSCLQLSKISGDDGYADAATALAVDASGDYIIGGYCGHQLTFATNTIVAADQDFFLAKYSTAPCTPLSNEEFKLDKALHTYPNPVKSVFNITTDQEMEFSIYSLTGVLVKSGVVNEQNNSVNISDLASGYYLVKTINQSHQVQIAKLVKE